MFSVNYNEIRERVCDFRKSLKATQQDLALYLDMKRGSYQSKEAEGSFDWEETIQLADYFNVSPLFIRYGVEDEQVKTIAKILNQSKMGTTLRQTYTIFDDLEKYKEDNDLYISFLNLDPSEQNRIIRYINANES